MLRSMAFFKMSFSLAVFVLDKELAKRTNALKTRTIISTGKYEVMNVFSFFAEKRYIKPPNYPMLDIIPSSGSKNDININPIKNDKITIKVGSKIEIK